LRADGVHAKLVQHVRLLIVDDSEEFLASASRLLGSQGMDVVACATSSANALRLAGTLEPDVVLVDVELGDEDGIALGNTLASRAPSTRVVLISSYEREELGDAIAHSHAVGFVPKADLGAAAIARLLG
jgi:DNA-binding NarL/FixJ family response regulator